MFLIIFWSIFGLYCWWGWDKANKKIISIRNEAIKNLTHPSLTQEQRADLTQAYMKYVAMLGSERGLHLFLLFMSGFQLLMNGISK